MHYYQFNIGDYLKSTLHLSAMEDLVYRRLLDRYYDTEKPLEADVDKLCRFIRMTAYKTETQQVLEEFFSITQKGWIQKRVQKELGAYAAKADTARANGRKGGRPKKTQRVNCGNPEQTQSKAKQEPLTNNHKPLTNNQSLSTEVDEVNTDYHKAALEMWERIKPIKKRDKPPNFNTWARDIRLLVENDKVEPKIVWSVFTWANMDQFWRPNILSPAKLRSQFDTLYAKMQNGSGEDVHARTAQIIKELDEAATWIQ